MRTHVQITSLAVLVGEDRRARAREDTAGKEQASNGEAREAKSKPIPNSTINQDTATFMQRGASARAKYVHELTCSVHFCIRVSSPLVHALCISFDGTWAIRQNVSKRATG